MQLDVNVLHILGISVSTFTEILTMTNILRQLDIDIMIPRNGATLHGDTGTEIVQFLVSA